MTGGVRLRLELLNNFLQKTVYINCIGFLKISAEIDYMDDYEEGGSDMLDTTRIHPDYYQMAKKIAKEAVDDNRDKDDQRDVVARVMENPKRLSELDLEDYAKNLGQRGKTNMMVLIDFVVQELTHPFQDPRQEFKTKLRKEDLFYKLTRESKYNMREHSIQTVKITKVDARNVKIMTDSGVPGCIMRSDLKDKT